MSHNNFSFYSGPSSNQTTSPQAYPRTETNSVLNTSPAKVAIPIIAIAGQPVKPRFEIVQGTVTQLFTSFGYVDNNIIFSKTDVMGPMVQVGDKVAVNVSVQPGSSMKYKGERVFKVTQPASKVQLPLVEISKSVETQKKADDPPAKICRVDKNPRPEEASKSLKKIQNPLRKQPITFKVASRRVSPTEKEPAKSAAVEKELVKATTVEKKATKESHTDAASLALRELTCTIARQQWPTVNMPDDFCLATLCYQQSFPLDLPLRLGGECTFSVLDKRIPSVVGLLDELLAADVNPGDGDSRYVARVILLYSEEVDDDHQVPVTRAVKVLVGGISQGLVAIGGAWSPSLDGPNPSTDPAVLIRTATRTCKALTGIDLSPCSSWKKFFEVRYHRLPNDDCKVKETRDSGNVVVDITEVGMQEESHLDTVVYYLVDLSSCVPSVDSWADLRRAYEEQLASTLASSRTETNADAEAQPTHFSKLVVPAMKIADLRTELQLRKINSRGMMEQLRARLTAALEKEKLATEAAALDPIQTSNQTSYFSASEETELRKLYVLPEKPSIITHQNRRAFDGLLKIKTMSLRSLLNYTDVTLESTFELALFARLFLSMVKRDAVFSIYKSIVIANEEDLQDNECKSKENTSRITVNKRLLSACYLLDEEKTGRISLTDLEVLVEGLGVCLSTDQMSALLAKAGGRSGNLEYRRLTDREVTASYINQEESEDVDYISELALGNKALFTADTSGGCSDERVERLRVEIDRSQRARQEAELRAAWMSEEAEKTEILLKKQTEELVGLRKEVDGLRTECQVMRDRGTRDKNQMDCLHRGLRNVRSLSLNLRDAVADVLGRQASGDMSRVSRGAQEARPSSQTSLPPIVQTVIAETEDLDLLAPPDCEVVIDDED